MARKWKSERALWTVLACASGLLGLTGCTAEEVPDTDSGDDEAPSEVRDAGRDAGKDASQPSKDGGPDASGGKDAGQPTQPAKDAAAPQPGKDAGAPAQNEAGTPAPASDAGQPVLDATAPKSDGGANVTPTDGGSPQTPDSGTRPSVPAPTGFTMRVVTKEMLSMPWEITWGPDNWLWVTERVGKTVNRFNPATGERKTLLTVQESNFTDKQGGLLGMALHPKLLKEPSSNFVYLAYTYKTGQTPARLRIVQYTYDAATDTLNSPKTLLEGLPGSNDHNSGRLVFGPDDKLYYTIGDQGANQFENKCKPVEAQRLPTAEEVTAKNYAAYKGKVLRIGLDGLVPTDNPEFNGVRSHVYSYGHRNAQGLAFAPDGRLFSSEQGPKTDDEVNLIQAGKNYGWPHIAGYKDGKSYVYGNWSSASNCASLMFNDYTIPAGVTTMTEASFTGEFVEPIATFDTVDSFDFENTSCGDQDFLCWPTIAPASLEVYSEVNGGFSGWGTSLLLPSLKTGSIHRVRVDESGKMAGDVEELFDTNNRYRDLTVAPDKQTFYVITDSGGETSGPTKDSVQVIANKGAILEFKPM